MKIYTKTGDKGETSLFGGKRVSKDNLRIEAYGTVDELNASIGLARAEYGAGEFDRLLEQIQNDLFSLGADLASPDPTKKSAAVPLPEAISRLEREIDGISARVDPLSNFILPGGHRAAAQLHVARTVCRRAERLTVRLAGAEPVASDVIIYLNRLSDLLFVLARLVNKLSGTSETKWKS